MQRSSVKTVVPAQHRPDGLECFMAEQILQATRLRVNVEEKEILHGVSLEVNRGETHVLMGPNGAG